MEGSSAATSRRMQGLDEEFNNFMHRVTEINGIVKKLASENKQMQNVGLSEADRYLHDTKFDVSQRLDEDALKLTVKEDRSHINPVRDECQDPNTMSQAAFMREVERDANKRYEERMVRNEKSDTVKLQANKAFRRQEYVQALSLYNKAIGFKRDSCVLYTNRALTYMHLSMHDKAMADCELALRLNENSLKAWLYKSKCHYVSGDEQAGNRCIREAFHRHPAEADSIRSFIEGFLPHDGNSTRTDDIRS